MVSKSMGIMCCKPTHIQVDDLGQERADDEDKQDVSEPLIELSLSADLGDDGSTQTLGSDNTQTSDERTDGQIDHHALLAVSRTDVPGDNGRADDDDAGVGEEAGGNDIVLHVLDVGDCALLGGVESDNHTAQDAEEAGHPADEAQPFLQEDPAEDCSDHDSQGT